ncbi:MAG: ESX secretion-associated protein EspG [Thermocrispum sp.]
MARRTPSGSGLILSPLEFDLLWEEFGGGDAPPYPLQVRSHGETFDERDRLDDEVFAGLQESGLAEGDEVAEQLARPLRILARPTRWVDLMVIGAERLRAVAAASRTHAVLAALDEQELALEPLRPEDMIPALLHVIGDVPPGAGERVSLPRAAYAAAMDAFARKGYGAFEAALSAAGVTGRAVRPVATMVSAPRTVAGQFGANGPGGRSPVLNWLDTEEGRYAMVVDSAQGEQWVTVTPADVSWLAGQLRSLLDGVARPPG